MHACVCRPFLIGYFVDGVVLAYDTPPPPTDEELLALEAKELAGVGDGAVDRSDA